MARYFTVDGDQLDASIGNYMAGSIDGKTQGNTNIFTTANNGMVFYPSNIDFVLTGVSGLGTPPIINVGWTAANYTDLVNGQALVNNLSTQGGYYRVGFTVANSIPIPVNTQVVLRVATAAIATTTYTLRVIIRGYYALN